MGRCACPVTQARRSNRTERCLTEYGFFYIVCVMLSRDYLGEFALLRLGDRAYGVTVRQEIELRIGRDMSIGAIYGTRPANPSSFAK
jgi:hypothetical protein